MSPFSPKRAEKAVSALCTKSRRAASSTMGQPSEARGSRYSTRSFCPPLSKIHTYWLTSTLAVQPALEGRSWRANVAVQVGDVFAYKGALWRCVQAHTTQGGWQPDKTPALWHRVEVVAEGTVRVWAAGIDYVAGDEVAYPDAEDELYVCQQAHTSQAGWEPPGVPALWSPASESRQENSPVEEVGV